MYTFQTIKDLAHSRGISLQELAIKANLSRNTIYSWKYKHPSLNNLTAVANILNVPVDYLLNEQAITESESIPSPKNKVDLKELLDEDNIRQRTISYGGEPISDHDMALIKSILARMAEKG